MAAQSIADSIIARLGVFFGQLTDARRPNKTIPLKDALGSALAMFLLKYPSLLLFDQATEMEKADLLRAFRIGRVPCDTQMRQIIDKVPTHELKGGFQEALSPYLDKALGQFAFNLGSKKKPDNYYIVSVDGTGFFSSPSVHCNCCLEKHHRDGTTTYQHQLLASVLVCPGRAEVLPLACEHIVRQDGTGKNDCERNAAKRLLAQFPVGIPAERTVFVEDALYANGPHLSQVTERGSHFICRIKADSHASLFHALGTNNRVRHYQQVKQGVQHLYRYLENVPLNDTYPGIRVNLVELRVVNTKTGATTVFHWVTDLPVSRGNIANIALAGRSRWKIENETFNTLKNQGYHFGHNYGHGHQYLGNNLSVLMLLAFLTDQLQQLFCKVFQAVAVACHSRKRLWEHLRAAFLTVECYFYGHILLAIAKFNRVKLE